jgi:hypothetical protein
MADAIVVRDDRLTDDEVGPESDWVLPVGGRIARSLDDRAGVESLERLHHHRRTIMVQLAPLKALHGTFGKWDDYRKRMLAAIAVRVRHELEVAGDRATDSIVDALARSDPQYERVLDQGIDGAAQYFRLQVELDEIEERIRSREIGLLAYNSELKLGR